MKYYAYYSATKDLRDDYTDRFILFMDENHKTYDRIFHNTETHRIYIISGDDKKTIQPEDEETRNGETIFTALMKKLADELSSGVTVVFEDIMSLGNTPEQIWENYAYFMSGKINMVFAYGNSLSTENILKTSPTITPQIEASIGLFVNSSCSNLR